MRLISLAFLVAASLGFTGCSAFAGPTDTGKVEMGSGDERTEHLAIADAVEQAVKARDFAALDAMETRFRTTRARTPSGVWKLSSYHAYLQHYLAEGIEKPKGCAYRMAGFVRDWRKAGNDSPAAVISDAAMLAKQAWCYRGTGYAASVPEQEMDRFGQGSAAAQALLEAHRAKASVDPEFYAVMIETYPGQHKLDGLDALVLEGAKREPYYHRIWFNAAMYHLPQWGGSLAEIDNFARLAAWHTRESDKLGMYVRVYWYLDNCDCGVLEDAADWDDVVQSMDDVQERYPSPHNAEYFARVACDHGDVETGFRFIRAAAPGNDDDALVARFASCRTNAEEAGQS